MDSKQILSLSIMVFMLIYAAAAAAECPDGEVIEIQPTEDQIMLCRWYDWNKEAIDCVNGEWPYLNEMLNFCQMYQLRKRLFSVRGRNWVENSKQCIVDEMKKLKDEAKALNGDHNCTVLNMEAKEIQKQCYLDSDLCCLDSEDWAIIAFTLEYSGSNSRFKALRDFRDATFTCISPTQSVTSNSSADMLQENDSNDGNNSTAKADTEEEKDNSKPSYRFLRLEVARDADDVENKTIPNRADYLDTLAREFAIHLATREHWAESLEWIAFGEASNDDNLIETMVVDLLIVDKDVMDGIEMKNDLVESSIDGKFVASAKQGDLSVDGYTVVKSYICTTWACEQYDEIKPLSALVIGDKFNSAVNTLANLNSIITIAVLCLPGL